MASPQDFTTERVLKQNRARNLLREERRNVRKNTRHQSVRRVKLGRSPNAGDNRGTGFHVWDMWIDSSNNSVWMCVDATTAVWKQIG